MPSKSLENKENEEKEKEKEKEKNNGLPNENEIAISMGDFHLLPTDIIKYILMFLDDVISLLRLSMTNKTFYKFATGYNDLWLRMLNKHYLAKRTKEETLIEQDPNYYYKFFKKTYEYNYNNKEKNNNKFSFHLRKAIICVKDGNLSELKKLIDKISLNEIYNQADKKGFTLIHWAIRNNEQEILNFFYKTASTRINSNNPVFFGKLKLDRTDEDKNTLLIWAIITRQEIFVLRWLITNGCNIEKCNNRQESPLFIAARYGYQEAVVLLLSIFSKNINLPSKHSHTPIHIAAFYGHVEIVKILAEKNADIRSPNSKGETPLHPACARGDDSLVPYLIGKGARDDIHKGNINGKTPFYFAVKSGKGELVNYLLEESNKNRKEIEIYSDLLPIAVKNADLHILQILVEKGVNIKTANSPLIALAVKAQDPDNDLDVENRSFIQHSDREAMLTYLLKMEVDPNIPGFRGNTALHYTVDHEYVILTKILLKNKADRNIVNHNNETPIDFAKYGKNEKILELFNIKASSDCSIQ